MPATNSLSIDAGNSTVTIGHYKNGKWAERWSWPSKADEPLQFYQSLLRDAILESSIEPEEIRRITLSCVVPDLTELLVEAFSTQFQQPVHVFNPALYEKLPIQVILPHEIGGDLVANALAAWESNLAPAIIVDFGTALSCTMIDADGYIRGVTIAPGLETAVQALRGNTAQLPEVPIELPDSAIGYDTVSAIQSGILHGYIGLVRHLLASFRKELGENYNAISTGGLSAALPPLKEDFDRIDVMHTLEGVRLGGTYQD